MNFKRRHHFLNNICSKSIWMFLCLFAAFFILVSTFSEKNILAADSESSKKKYLKGNEPSLYENNNSNISYESVDHSSLVSIDIPETKALTLNDNSNVNSDDLNEPAVLGSIQDPIKKTHLSNRVLNDSSRGRISDRIKEMSSSRLLDNLGPFLQGHDRTYYDINNNGDKRYLTLDADLQTYAEKLLKKYKVPRGVIVALEPKTGKIKVLAGHSEVSPGTGSDLLSKSSFPAASLFKIITASAAIETSGLSSSTPVKFRGGTYTLNKYNYLPNVRTDKRVMTLGTAMAKSCNPAFARIALNTLDPETISAYALNFGFDKKLVADFDLPPSTISLGDSDYQLARTAAGFGDVFISPVHAASMIAALGNRGLMMRPYMIDSIEEKNGLIKIVNGSQVIQQVVLESTANELITMMEATTKKGTGRRQFRRASTKLRQVSIASKTGTLSGSNPKGRYYWFVGVLPADDPQLAIASLVIDDGTARINGVGLGRLFLEHYYSSDTIMTSNTIKSDEVSFIDKSPNSG